jgi:hypothetical protein
VLFKRKPVSFPDPPALPLDLNTKVWYIPYTKEWYLTYDEYLARMDYYNTKKFVCEITGNSCLTFFEAFDSEMKEMKIVEDNFPEHLKEPILRHLQFSTVPRIDQLVDNVYSTFKIDYYPGETVMIRLNDYKNDFKTKCIIREKATFNAVLDANNVLRPAYCQYRVSRVDNGIELVVDENQITRDRNNFTKWFVKTFIKLSVTRSPKLGAPWIVKQKYAERYRIPTDLPTELAHFKDKPKQAKRPVIAIRPKELLPKQKKGDADKNTTNKKGHVSRAKIEVPKPPPPPKRTIEEDLKLSLETTIRKPIPHKLEELGDVVQDALETWTFLNIYRVPLILDTFTFDDFLSALKWDSSKKRCYLLDEIFSASLSGFIGPDRKSITIPIPEEFEEDDEEEGEEEADSDQTVTNGKHLNGSVKEENETPEVQPNGHDNNNNNNNKSGGDDEDQDENEDEDEDEDESVEEETNRVDDYLTYRNTSWKERLQNRSFKDGNWQIILLGVLDEVRDIKSYTDTVLEIFDTLAPIDASVSPGNLQFHFFHNLSLRLRIKALSILFSLLVNSAPIRSHLDKCMEEATYQRRERSEKIREYKAIFQKAQDIDKESREWLNKGATPNAPSSTNDQSTEPTNTNPSHTSGKKRRRAGLTLEPTEEELKFAKGNEEYAKLLASRTAQLRLAEGLRLERRSLDRKISELDIQRVKYIGKDRLFNRYWWFENNGLPNLGGKGSKRVDEDDEDEDVLEDEEDEDDEYLQQETYLMGRLWVQGPSEDDLKYGLQLEADLIKEWKKLNEVEESSDQEDDDEDENGKEEKEKESKVDDISTAVKNEVKDESKPEAVVPLIPPKFIDSASKLFNVKFDALKSTVFSTDGHLLADEHGAFVLGIKPAQRKIIEEKPDPLLTCEDWRYYDNPEEITSLIKWLNQWGVRESRLLKELNNIKDQIISSISSRRKALRLDSKSEEEIRLLEIIENTVLTDSEAESSEESENEGSNSDDDSDISELESLTAEPTEVEPHDSRRTRKSIAQAEKLEQERREKEELIRKKIDERQAKRARSKPSLRIAKRELKKRKLKEHEEKKDLLEESKLQLSQLKQENELRRCLDWINQSAIEKLGHSHYEGPKQRVTERSRRGGRRR